MVNWALQVLDGLSKAVPSWSASEARKKRPCLEFSGRPMKRALPFGIGSDLEVELVEGHESVSDVNSYVGGIHWRASLVNNDEISGAGSETGVDFGNGFCLRFRVCLRL